MKLIDISWPISPTMTQYKTKQEVALTPTKNMAEHGARESLITLGSHSGTHIDAPSHFLAGGATIEHVSVDTLMGPCFVVDCTNVTSKIQISDFSLKIPVNTKRLLFKTANSLLAPDAPFNPDFIYLDGQAAAWLVEHGVQLVGIDYLGIERAQPDRCTHTTLLGANIVILEGLRLADVTEGSYDLQCLPLRIPGLDAAPARAMLRPLNP